MKKRMVIGGAVAAVAAAAVLWVSGNGRLDDGDGVSASHADHRVASSDGAVESGAVRKSRMRASAGIVDPFLKRAGEIAAMQQTNERDDAIRSLAGEWAAHDPVAAEHWASTLAEVADRGLALNHVCLRAADSAPVEAIGMARRNGLGDGVVEAIVGRWADTDFAAAEDWVNGSTMGDERNTLLAKLAQARAEKYPVEAAAMVSESMTSGAAQEEAAMSVLHQWLRRDPDAAVAWIDAFPDGPLKERGKAEIEGMKMYEDESATVR